jgi:hypothetical protein
LGQTLEPVPDDFASYFRTGFVTFSYNHATDPNVKAKFPNQYKLWIDSVNNARGQSDRERDAAGFYPDRSIMDPGATSDIGAAWPFGTGVR